MAALRWCLLLSFLGSLPTVLGCSKAFLEPDAPLLRPLAHDEAADNPDQLQLVSTSPYGSSRLQPTSPTPTVPVDVPVQIPTINTQVPEPAQPTPAFKIPGPVAQPAQKMELPQPTLQPAPSVDASSIPPVAPPSVVEPPKPEPAIIQAVRHFLANKPQLALEALDKTDPTSNEMLVRLLPIVMRAAEGNLSTASTQELNLLRDQLASAEKQLRDRVPLQIGKICFCKEIRGFGDFEPLPDGHEFIAGSGSTQGELVNVYLELRNLTVRSSGDLHQTSLSSRLEIRDLQGKVVERRDQPTQVFSSRSPRQDFFLHGRFYLSPTLPPGLYTLAVQVEDQHAQPKRVDRKVLDFRVTPKPLPRADRVD